MPQEFKAGCKRPEVKKTLPAPENVGVAPIPKEESMIRVGKAAPDFSAAAFFQGKFVNVSLSEYKGQWVSLCFYPGDFTFV